MQQTSRANDDEPQPGAVPIRRDNELLGAVGVSGATSQEDEDIARAGMVAL